MRRSGFLAGLGALAGCASHAHAARAPRETSTRNVRIVALGDSLAFGTGASSPANGFIFQAYLRVRERYPRARIDDLAIPGSTTGDVLAVQVPRLARERADVVVVCVGANDVVRRVPTATFARTYATVMNRIRQSQPQSAIVCCGVPDIGMSPLFTGHDHDAMVRGAFAADAAVRTIAGTEHAEFVDLYAVTVRAQGEIARFLSDDRFHPSDAGYHALADALAPLLTRAVNGSG